MGTVFILHRGELIAQSDFADDVRSPFDDLLRGDLYSDPYIDLGPPHNAQLTVAPGKPRAKVYREQQSRAPKPRDLYGKRGR